MKKLLALLLFFPLLASAQLVRGSAIVSENFESGYTNGVDVTPNATFDAKFVEKNTGTAGKPRAKTGMVVYGRFADANGTLSRAVGTFDASQWAVVKLKSYGFNGANYTMGAACEVSNDADANKDFYEAKLKSDASTATNISIVKVVNGSIKTLASTTASPALATNDTVEIECTKVSSTQIDIKFIKNGNRASPLLSVSDTASCETGEVANCEILADGNPGFLVGGASGSPDVDDISMGNLVAGSVTVVPSSSGWFK